MNIIADTNIFLAIALNQSERQSIIDLTKSAVVFSPEILPYEIGNALSAMLKRRQINAKSVGEILKITQGIKVRLLTVDIASALKIAIEYKIYAYDAYFLLAAQSKKCPLLTLDKKMKEVAEDMNINLLGNF